MECNKDEAIRAKEIAEKKFTDKDYIGAKKFLQKAQKLYPQLQGVVQMQTVCDVHISAVKRISSGEVDWYSVLDVSPWADDETIKKQYRKLVLMLHPDKNNAMGADSAFNLVSEAWGVLSDKAKRLAYNEKLNPVGLQHRMPTQTKTPSAASNTNGFCKVNANVTSDHRTRSASTRPSPPVPPSTNHRRSESTRSGPSVSYSASNQRQNQNTQPGPSAATPTPIQRPDTFWTLCNRCNTQFEYLRVYLNHNLLCPNCREAFLAVERAPPLRVMKSSGSSRQKRQNSRNHAANSNPSGTKSSGPDGFAAFNSTNSADLQGNYFSRMAGVGGGAALHSATGQGANVFQQSYVKVNSKYGETQVASGWEKNFASNRMGDFTPGKDQLLRKRRSDEAGLDSYRVELRRPHLEAERGYGSLGKSITGRELSPLEVRNMLMEKAQSDICKHLKEWSANEAKLQGNKIQKSMVDMDNDKKEDDYAVMNKGNGNKTASSHDSDEDTPVIESINVPDPDFHNFDLDRTESSFEDDQVWAAYDENDGMPRYYARIYKVMSLNPFKMKISWLNSRSCIEFSPLDWVGSGFPKSCGDFRAGRHEISKTLNAFSHKVKWAKGGRGAIRILPRKGDIWALYRNWSPDWNEQTPDDIVHKYDMVEVLDDYNDEEGVSVIPLVKVAGFRTVFCKHTDPEKAIRIPKEEMFRFSHQVPDHLLTGEEGDNAPKGCRELDPAATPLELLQVITEANETEKMESDLEAKEEVVRMEVNASEAREGAKMMSKPDMQNKR